MVSDFIDEVIGFFRDESDEVEMGISPMTICYSRWKKLSTYLRESILMLEGYLFLIMPLHTVKWPMML